MNHKSFLFITTILLVLLCWECSTGQKKERPSPLRTDSSLFNSGELKIAFSSPSIRGRKIWGGLVSYDTIWRTGANHATVFSTEVDISIAGQSLDSGAYSVFTIPGKETWQVMINEHWNQWGTYEYDSIANAAVIQVVPERSDEFSEQMKFYFSDQSLIFHWEYLRFSLQVE